MVDLSGLGSRMCAKFRCVLTKPKAFFEKGNNNNNCRSALGPFWVKNNYLSLNKQ